jgi:hypothetical protein
MFLMSLFRALVIVDRSFCRHFRPNNPHVSRSFSPRESLYADH